MSISHLGGFYRLAEPNDLSKLKRTQEKTTAVLRESDCTYTKLRNNVMVYHIIDLSVPCEATMF